ncbi:alpha-N-acetylgalactosamine-specific lectin-like [Patiria miniata]|uniref:C-type lectin domain-containing protein n=1 Tax=Patiria miniata TaxID=46514 RepID=A0A913Z2L8_PATMI|nr:alpha-N-acetylgalactosamine-specific lectin-like [Patiria miniata]
MAAPRSLEEMNFMAELARKVDNNSYAWIACNDKEVEGIWECDGQEGREPFTKWGNGQPDNHNNQDCGTCHSRLALECSCPPQWQWWGKDCYRLTPRIQQTWDQAKSACQDMSGKMAAPRSLEEMSFMANMTREIDVTGAYPGWIACNDKKVEGTWECDGQEGSEPFLAWADKQPDNNNNEDCADMAEMKHDNKMNDVGCDSTHPHMAFCIRRAACTYGLIQLRH